MSFGITAFSQAPFGGVGASDVNVTPTSVVATLSLGTPTYEGSANVTLTSLVSTLSLGTTLYVGSANVSPTSLVTTLSLGTLSVTSSANVTPTSVVATTALGTLSILGSANVAIDSVSLTGTLSNDNLILIVLSDDSYFRSRTVYVDYRDNYLNSTIHVEEQNRVVQIPERPYQVQPNILQAA